MSNPHSTDWTPEELAALPQTENVFDKPALNFDEHQWLQQGYELTDNCPIKTAACHTGNIPLPSGQMLIKDAKGYRLVDELTRV